MCVCPHIINAYMIRGRMTAVYTHLIYIGLGPHFFASCGIIINRYSLALLMTLSQCGVHRSLLSSVIPRYLVVCEKFILFEFIISLLGYWYDLRFAFVNIITKNA